MTLTSSSQSGLRVWSGWLGGAILGVILLVAAWAKAIDPEAFVRQIEGQGLDFLFPAAAIAFLGIAVEVAIGLGLLLGIRRPWLIWPSAALILFFIFLTGRNYWLDSQGLLDPAADCGCFGNLVQRTPSEAFWQDLVLLVPPLLLVFWGRAREFSGFPVKRSAFAGAVALLAVGFALISPDLPLDDLATRLSAGVRIDEVCLGSEEDEGGPVCLDTVIPEMHQGRHIVIIDDLKSADFLAAVQSINEFMWKVDDPALWVATSATPEEIHAFRWQSGPSFEMTEAPELLLRGLHRRLPRSFLVEDGEVVETYSGLPPFERWSETQRTAGQHISER